MVGVEGTGAVQGGNMEQIGFYMTVCGLCLLSVGIILMMAGAWMT